MNENMSQNVRNRSKHTKTTTDGYSEGSGQSSKSRVRTEESMYSWIKSLLKWTLISVTIVVFIVFIISPLVFRHSLTVRRLLVFMNYVNIPLFKDLKDPKNSFDMNCTRNLYITNEYNDQTIRLGVWHKLPFSRSDDCLQHNHSVDPSLAFADNRPVFLYLHGNGGARGGHHRRQLYELLSKSSQLDAHVVALDYRGYGDSTNVWPTADGLHEDSNAVYNWLLKQTHINTGRVIVWGHSLGTAVSVRFVSELPKVNSPFALVLDAPFTTIGEAIRYHPFSILYKNYFPYFDSYFVEPVVDSKVTNFDSISFLNNIEIPILILHAQDDRIVPFHLGHRLYEKALELQPKSAKRAQMVAFNGQYGYGHKHLFRDPELPNIIHKFIIDSKK